MFEREVGRCQVRERQCQLAVERIRAQAADHPGGAANGLSQATGGSFMAEVHKASGPVPKGGGGMHLHHIDFQFNYMIKGWCKVEIVGEGVFKFEEGDTWLQPPAIKHNFLECSPDCEILEICSPGDFETIEV